MMSNDLETALFEDFPKLYRLGLDYGFECGDGWYALLRRLSEQLEPLGVTAGQVKVKYGQLRFYVNSLDCSEEDWDAITDLIDAAEVESELTCMECGADGETVMARCKPCRESRGWRS